MNRRSGRVQAVSAQVRSRVSALALVGFIVACGSGGSGISGEYVGQPGAWVDRLVFGPGTEVRAFQRGDAAVGVFGVDATEILLTIGTDQDKLTIVGNGCLDGGHLGTYCKR
jgi:hypothetical protein